MSTTLPLFWKLSSASKKERVDASVKLISTLEQFQALHVPQSRSDGSDNEGGDGLDALNSQDVSYSIRRLVRGLASPRESSRLGFSVALTELLSRIDTVTCAQVVALIVDSTKRNGSMNGQEERDVLFARLFGIAAVVRAGLLVRQTPSTSSNAPVSSLETYQSVLTYLLEIGEAKSWLMESAWWTIGLAIDAVQASSVPWRVEALDATIKVVYSKDGDSFWTQDKVAITLKLQPLTPNHAWDKTLGPMFKGQNIFASNNLVSLGRILKESAVDEEDTLNSGTGSWKAQLHVAWNVIFDRLLPSGSETTPQGSFSEFFRVVVDESLFTPSSSPERKYWGFQVFKKALARVKPTELPMLFTKNLMRNWINHLSNKDRYLHNISLDVAKHIQTLVQSSPSLGFPLILQLTGINGSGQFDKLTRTKTVESILTVMDSAGIKSYILSLLEQVNSPAEEEPSAIDSRRTWIADQFAALVRNGSIPKTDEWIQIVLDYYVVNGLFVVRKKSENNLIHALRVSASPPFTEAVQQHCRERLLSCLGVLNAHLMVVKQGEHTHKETGVASDGEFWTSKALSTIALLDKDAKHVKPLIDIDEEVQALLTKTEKTVGQLRKTNDDQREVAKGFELILSSFLLQCRCGETDSLEHLEAILEATSKMFLSEQTPKKSKKSKSQTTPPSEDDPSPIDVLVDVIIGFLEKASAFTRSVANESFSRVTSAVQGSTLELILSQLERREPSELVEEDEDEEMSSGDDVDDANEEEDEEEDEEEGSSSGEAGSGESDSEEGDDEAADEVRKKIEDALKASGMGVGKDDSEEDSDEEELMDDEQMMALDDTLANIFRSRTHERKSKKRVDAQREATHFKNRVLDLVDIFVRREPRSPLNVRLLLPLVELATKSTLDERQLSDKASGILKSRLVKSKDVPTTALRDEVETVLREVHRRAQKSHASDALGVLSQASLYLCRILISLGEEDVAVTMFQESFDDYVSRKASPLAFSFFQDWARRFPTLGWKLRDSVLESSSKAVNLYRRCQAFQLLQIILNQPDKEGEPAAIAAFYKALQKTILDLVTLSVDDDCGLSPTQIKDLLKLVLSCIRQTRKTTESLTIQVWDPTAWKALHDKLSSSNRFKSASSVLNMCRQVESTAAQCKQTVGKRKAESDEATGTDPSKKSNRKKQKKRKS
ncbi:hypothetical protein OG21DRAFT_1494920 [Imleria badia]|nr:hypothetical protein OG21DRAFT_1494920 [Imleria badia]